MPTRVEGKTIEEIVAQYAKDRDVPEEDVVYEIVEEKKGILGLGAKVEADVYCSRDVVDFLLDYLDNYFKGLELEGDIEVSKEDELYRVELNADNNAMLIGRGGATLQAINTVVKGAASAVFHKRIQVLVDINGYKEDRYQKLEYMARREAKTVQRTKQSVLLEPMPADERKVIHQYLSHMRNIRTASEGEGQNRCVRILYDDGSEKAETEE